MHELSDQARKFLDICTGLFAGVAAALTLNQVAAVLTIVATMVSIACGSVRLYDRFAHGRPVGGE